MREYLEVIEATLGVVFGGCSLVVLQGPGCSGNPTWAFCMHSICINPLNFLSQDIFCLFVFANNNPHWLSGTIPGV